MFVIAVADDWDCEHYCIRIYLLFSPSSALSQTHTHIPTYSHTHTQTHSFIQIQTHTHTLKHTHSAKYKLTHTHELFFSCSEALFAMFGFFVLLNPTSQHNFIYVVLWQGLWHKRGAHTSSPLGAGLFSPSILSNISFEMSPEEILHYSFAFTKMNA